MYSKIEYYDRSVITGFFGLVCLVFLFFVVLLLLLLFSVVCLFLFWGCCVLVTAVDVFQVSRAVLRDSGKYS